MGSRGAKYTINQSILHAAAQVAAAREGLLALNEAAPPPQSLERCKRPWPLKSSGRPRSWSASPLPGPLWAARRPLLLLPRAAPRREAPRALSGGAPSRLRDQLAAGAGVIMLRTTLNILMSDSSSKSS